MAKSYKKFKDYIHEEDDYDDEYEEFSRKKKKDMAIKNKRKMKYDQQDEE